MTLRSGAVGTPGSLYRNQRQIPEERNLRHRPTLISSRESRPVSRVYPHEPAHAAGSSHSLTHRRKLARPYCVAWAAALVRLPSDLTRHRSPSWSRPSGPRPLACRCRCRGASSGPRLAATGPTRDQVTMGSQACMVSAELTCSALTRPYVATIIGSPPKYLHLGETRWAK